MDKEDHSHKTPCRLSYGVFEVMPTLLVRGQPTYFLLFFWYGNGTIAVIGNIAVQLKHLGLFSSYM